MKNRSLDCKYKFGWMPDLPDFRDQNYKFGINRPLGNIVIRPIPTPDSVDLRAQLPPIYDQGHIGSCTSNALAAAFDYQRHKQKLPFITPSRLFIYYNSRAIEGWESWDSGAYIRDGIKTLNVDGICAESKWPYDVSKFSIKPPEDDYKDALNNQTISYHRIDASLDDMLHCLGWGYPFVFGFTLYESFVYYNTSVTGIVPMPKPGERLLGGHAVLACGYSKRTQMFLVRNSWGTGWGLQGYCWMPFDYVSSPNLSDDRWTLALVEKGNLKINNTITSFESHSAETSSAIIS